MDWKSDQHWLYETFPLDEPSSTFRDFMSLIELWRSKRREGQRTPQWSAFDLEDLEDWWGWLHIYDAVEADEPTFVVRLWGTKLVNVLGYDITGTTIRASEGAEAADAKHITRYDLEFARHLLDHGLIGRGSGPLDINFGVAIDYHEIMMPLCNAAGQFDKLLYACRAYDRAVSQ